jgi:Domain of unknown function (DUF1918)
VPGAADSTLTTQLQGGNVNATIGDRLIVRATHLDEPARDAEILEVHGADGGPPYLVRWSDNGHSSLYFPGGDAEIHHAVSSSTEHRR